MVTCLLFIGLYVFDITTDFKFSFDMFYPNITNTSIQDSTCPILKKNVSMFPSCTEDCWAQLLDQTETIKLEFIKKEDYEVTGWIALYHCIQPFVVTMIVFLSINKGSPTIPDVPRCLQVGSWVPIPALTYIYTFYLDVRSHHVRSKPAFRTKMVGIEKEIKDYQVLGKL